MDSCAATIISWSRLNLGLEIKWAGPPDRYIVCQSFPRVCASGLGGNTTCGDKQDQEMAPEGRHSLVG